MVSSWSRSRRVRTEEAQDDRTEPGLGMNALAGATGAAVGFAVGGPGGAVIGAAATPYLAVVFQKMGDKIWADRSRRANKMLETAAEAAGLSTEELADRAMESEESRFLTDKAVQAAADTIWPEGVKAIGRALASGLLAADKPALDIRLRILGIMQGLDEMHVALLELLVKYEPDLRQRVCVATPHRLDSYQNTYMGGDRPDNPKVWSVGERKWDTAQISAVRPNLELVLGSLLGDLTQRGLARENDTAPETVTRLSEELAQQVNRQAGAMQRGKSVGPITLQPPTISRTEASWSPTELGEKVLGFYAEAGTEDSPRQS
jgi:hypothetical protein